MEGVIAVFIPIVVSLGAFLMIWGTRYLENKENMAMIERGIDPATMRRRRRNADPSQTLKNALMFSKSFNLEEGEKTAVFFGLIAIFGGLGMLAAYLYERKNPPSNDMGGL